MGSPGVQPGSCTPLLLCLWEGDPVPQSPPPCLGVLLCSWNDSAGVMIASLWGCWKGSMKCLCRFRAGSGTEHAPHGVFIPTCSRNRCKTECGRQRHTQLHPTAPRRGFGALWKASLLMAFSEQGPAGAVSGQVSPERQKLGYQGVDQAEQSSWLWGWCFFIAHGGRSRHREAGASVLLLTQGVAAAEVTIAG